MRILLLFLLAAFVVSSCNKLDIEKGTPKCVEEKIKDFNENSNCHNANVKEYSFQGDIVYTFDPGTCGTDMTMEVMDSDCTSLGYLGGIAGNKVINGEDFSNATFIRSIWEK